MWHDPYAATFTERPERKIYTHRPCTMEDLERDYWNDRHNSKFIDRNAGTNFKSNRKCEQDAFDNLDLFYDEED